MNLRRILIQAALAALGVAASLVVFVPIVQFTDNNEYDITHIDPKTGLELYTPGGSYTVETGCFENVAHINNLGFHGPDVSIQKKQGVYRIVVLGSSYAEARQVPVDAMYSTLLQNKLNALPDKKFTYEVIPLGVNGNGTVLDTLYYEEYGAALDPDLVINIESEFELLDKTDASYVDGNGKVTLAPPAQGGSRVAQAVRAAMRRVKLLVNLYNRYLTFNAAARSFIEMPLFFMHPKTSPRSAMEAVQANDARWKVKEALVSRLAQEVEARGSRFLLASWLSASAPTTTVQEYPAHMSAIAQARGFSYVDLTKTVSSEEKASGKPTSWPCDAHWSLEGNQYVADALYGYITAHAELLSK